MFKLLSPRRFFMMLSLALPALLPSCGQAPQRQPSWPAITPETRPWSRWWWQGSALTKEGITKEMEAYKQAGLGGLEITPIYGVHGYEDKFIDYLSPAWMELLAHTLKEAGRLGMGIDMATGTGWPFGGPWVSAADACKNVQYKVYEVKGGDRLREKIQMIQKPYLRAVGNQVYEVFEGAATEGRPVQGTRKEPHMRRQHQPLQIKDLVEPVSANKNLQALAIDQVQFEKPLVLQAVIAYNDAGGSVDLTGKVDASGNLDWVAPQGAWKLYALFQGWHGKMVERAGPGGEGNVIDHFSADALKRYLNAFDTAFRSYDITPLRGFFNDSYEVDDARGAADWTPGLLQAFKERRGYDLRTQLPALFGHDTSEKNQRVLCDYRETIAELLLENFTKPWKTWAHAKSAIVRNQAHGSPANILDLYATVDIPEIEGTEALRIKMATSAGNVTGKKLVSSESATWLNEHFESNLANVKTAVDRFMLNGVNHIFYHGTSYSPPGEPWPGWLFYAAVHLNPRNSLWGDFATLNTYVARCQSFLQNTKADNDVLLYYPIYDRLSAPGNEMIEHFDGIGKQFANTPFEHAASLMLEKGYSFDYISDRQIDHVTLHNNLMKTEGGAAYKILVIPHCRYMPLATLQKIIKLAEEGATVIMFQGKPEAVPGYNDLAQRQRQFDALIAKVGVNAKTGAGNVVQGDSLDLLLSEAKVRRESMVDKKIQFIRKRNSNGNAVYFISNNGVETFDGWLPLQSEVAAAVIYDPMQGTLGKADVRNGAQGVSEVYVQLTRGQTLIVEAHSQKVTAGQFPYNRFGGSPVALQGRWKITFTSGGPQLPAAVETDTLSSWTLFPGTSYKSFSGTASYTVSFSKPAAAAGGFLLDLGQVKESAVVILNATPVATLLGPVYQVRLDAGMIKEKNILEVRVSNLMANRISDLDKRGVFWKKFYNVNFPARLAENRKNNIFDASHWQPRASGLLGPVTLQPLAIK